MLPNQRLAEHIRLQSHNKNHTSPMKTLACSHSYARIHRARWLARKVEEKCMKCPMKKAKLTQQRMGQLPLKGVILGNPLFTNVRLNLLGPTLVKGVINM